MTNLTDSQKVSGTVTYLDKRRKPAQVDGAPVWASSDENIVHVEPSSDGFSAVVSAVDLGSATVTVTADADLGDGVVNVSASEDFQVTAGPAAGASISFGAPEEQ